MPKVKITDAKGLVQESGTGLQVDGDSVFNGGSRLGVTALTGNSTLTRGGVFTLSMGSAITTTLPAASSVAGSVFVFRNLTAQAHILTGSDSGVASFNGLQTATGSVRYESRGKVTLGAVIGNSITLLSDGRAYQVLATSGSHTFAGFPG